MELTILYIMLWQVYQNVNADKDKVTNSKKFEMSKRLLSFHFLAEKEIFSIRWLLYLHARKEICMKKRVYH